MEPNQTIKDELNALFTRSTSSSNSPAELDKINDEFEALIAKYPFEPNILFIYNEFRIKHLDKLSKKRPQILTGGVFSLKYPNIHSVSLFEVADVVCLTTAQKASYQASEVPCDPTSFFPDILKRLPKGFKPDFYWDNQVESQHFIPNGIEKTPFPIIASVCHAFLHKSIEQICELFDKVIPISPFYGNILRKKYPDKIIDMPFGLNWGSYHQFILPEWNKSIDLCLILEETNSPVYEGRNQVIKLTKQFKEKYGDRFNIYIVDKLEKAHYLQMLKKSRIAINVTGLHGPYNYRTIEAMCSGSMVFQYDWNGFFNENQFSSLFTDGVHGAGFTFETFEKKLLYYLENKEVTTKIAKQAYDFLIKNFSYKKLYQDLIEKVKGIKYDRHVSTPNHHINMIYYNQANPVLEQMVARSSNKFKEPWIELNNLMILNFDLCKKFHEEALKVVPKEHLWLLEWNFLLLSIEKGEFTKQDIEKVEKLLDNPKAELAPFDEIAIIFKYYLSSNQFPNYQFNAVKDEFIRLNIELIKVSDNPKARASLHRAYALKAIRYMEDQFGVR